MFSQKYAFISDKSRFGPTYSVKKTPIKIKCDTGISSLEISQVVREVRSEAHNSSVLFGCSGDFP